MPLGNFDIRIVENGHAPSALALETQTRQCNALLGILRVFFQEKQNKNHLTRLKSKSYGPLHFPFHV